MLRRSVKIEVASAGQVSGILLIPDNPFACLVLAHGVGAGMPWLAGGKSFGGRMTSQAQAERPLPHVAGLAFLGFPLHPAGKQATGRAQHLSATSIPMLFPQGTRDALADRDLLAAMAAQLPSASLHLVADADHSFHVPARSGRTDGDVLDGVLDALAAWGRGGALARRQAPVRGND